ncbi:GreA/GreB family elongation factor [Anaerobacillus isosaccharinicus]|uniref:GreA/GreB family elongation factor n=1 Tax=Anaerobacillus isosaccharinicus TaxID=1532552 RepID=A0A1S2MEB1_9BACI|nr:GreA/GreB family elongation factor [Anaerobacillus isosaccharinicus]MBA5586523.1 GreA/GreB family elongation factor [Anaerobacillus isosaccharinicus]QOY35236.1 GreA/GreB family elongation factor [Anaerobacillus isosaccharinicus]
MSHNLAIQGSKMQLINQLVFFDEQMDVFNKQFLPEYNSKRKNVMKVLADYSATLEKVLADFSEEQLKKVVLIGSKVKFRYLDDDETETVTIVFPNLARPEEEIVSFLSPIGLQLLLGKCGEVYELELPVGKVLVEIEEVTFGNKGTTE